MLEQEEFRKKREHCQLGHAKNALTGARMRGGDYVSQNTALVGERMTTCSTSMETPRLQILDLCVFIEDSDSKSSVSLLLFILSASAHSTHFWNWILVSPALLKHLVNLLSSQSTRSLLVTLKIWLNNFLLCSNHPM